MVCSMQQFLGYKFFNSNEFQASNNSVKYHLNKRNCMVHHNSFIFVQ